MSFLSKIKYPRILLFIVILVLTYFLFTGNEFVLVKELLLSLGYFGAFVAGIMFVYGFTSPLATGILIVLASSLNIWVAGFIAGFGAVLGDLIIFRFIRSSFNSELELLKQEKIIIKIKDLIPERFRKSKLKEYLVLIFAGFIIASPLPDEFGVSLLAMSKNVSELTFVILSYILNTIGIFIILGIGALI
jgi:hypothetical protein